MTDVTFKTLAAKFGRIDESSGTWEGRFDAEQLANMVSFVMQQYADQVRNAGDHFIQVTPGEPSKVAVKEFMLFLSEHHLM